MQSTKKIVINAAECKQEVNIEIIAHKLNKLLEESKISTKLLSETTGISIASLNNLKRGEGNPTIGTLNAICKFFEVPLIELLGIDHSSQAQKETIVIPVFDLRLAHQQNENNLIDKMLLETPKNINPKNIYGVMLNNNFLLPLYEKGTIFILAGGHQAIDGDIVLLRIQNSLNSLKRIFINKDNLYLKNINIDNNIESYNKNDLEVLGIVIQIIQKNF